VPASTTKSNNQTQIERRDLRRDIPLNTRTMNLITLLQLPPIEAYLNYLSLRHAIRLHFLPQHHALDPPLALTDTHPNLRGLHRLYALSKHLVQGKLENRTTTLTVDRTNTLPYPNPDKTTTPQQLPEEWLHTLPNHTVIIYTDGSKLENGSVGCGWATFHCGDQQLYQLGEGSCHLGNWAEVYNADSTQFKKQSHPSSLPPHHKPQQLYTWTTRRHSKHYNSTNTTTNMPAGPLKRLVTSAYWAGRSPPPGAPPTATSKATNEPTHSPNGKPRLPFPATSRSPPRRGYWLKHERSSFDGGKQNYHSQSPDSSFPATSSG